MGIRENFDLFICYLALQNNCENCNVYATEMQRCYSKYNETLEM